MVVDITNLTDGPGKAPTQINIFGRSLAPGVVLRLPAELVDSRIKDLEKTGHISIGAQPSWYAAFKAKSGRSLSKAEKDKRNVVPIQPVYSKELVTIAEEVPAPVDEITPRRRDRRSNEGV